MEKCLLRNKSGSRVRNALLFFFSHCDAQQFVTCNLWWNQSWWENPVCSVYETAWPAGCHVSNGQGDSLNGSFKFPLFWPKHNVLSAEWSVTESRPEKCLLLSTGKAIFCAFQMKVNLASFYLVLTSIENVCLSQLFSWWPYFSLVFSNPRSRVNIDQVPH